MYSVWLPYVFKVTLALTVQAEKQYGGAQIRFPGQLLLLLKKIMSRLTENGAFPQRSLISRSVITPGGCLGA